MLVVTPISFSVIIPASHFIVVMIQLRAAETEIKDLQSEVELEKISYLSNNRSLEQDVRLFQQLLDQVQSLIQQDCNCSNVKKIKCKSVWDEESCCGKIPEPDVAKKNACLQVRGVSGSQCHPMASSGLTSRSINGNWTALTCVIFCVQWRLLPFHHV